MAYKKVNPSEVLVVDPTGRHFLWISELFGYHKNNKLDIYNYVATILYSTVYN